MASVPKIIDTTANLSAEQARVLRALGVETIFGYLNPLGASGKVLTPARARILAAAGLRVGLVSEGWGDFAHSSFTPSAGTRDAQNALRNAPLLGAPKGTCIYFAVDCDATWGQIITFVLPYFEAIACVLAGQYTVGVYGSGAVCASVQRNKLATSTWLAQSMGWLNSRLYAASADWTLKQLLPAQVAGISCDPNEARAGALVGDYEPFKEAT